jgi:nucleolar protein 53
VDPTEFGAGSAAFELTEAVKSSGAYDPWAPAGPVEEIKDGLETVQPKKVKVRCAALLHHHFFRVC